MLGTFAKDLIGNWDSLKIKLSSESNILKILNNLSSEFLKLNMRYIEQILQLFTPIIEMTKSQESLDTVSFMIKTVVSTFEAELKNSLNNFTQLKLESNDSFNQNSNQYMINGKNLIIEGDKILEEYFKTDKQLHKYKIAYENSIIETENILNNKLVFQSKSVINLEEEFIAKTNFTYKLYADQINSFNSFMQYSKSKFFDILDRFQSNEVLRINSIKDLFKKSFSNIHKNLEGLMNSCKVQSFSQLILWLK